MTLAARGADTPLGAHPAAAYGVAGVLGWMSNLVIGGSYKFFPGFVAAARVQAGVLIAFNVGVAAAVGGLLADRLEVLRAGSVTLAVAATVYAAATARTLALAVLDPRPSWRPLSVP